VQAVGYPLSDVAREGFGRLRFLRRGLGHVVAASPGVDVYELNETVTLRQFSAILHGIPECRGAWSLGRSQA